jgi:lactate dehydrogenase-like 2-hydroxyacid dehydrogenase
LKSGQLAAAGLDVFEMEPAVNPDYLIINNVFLLPHLGSAIIETRTRMGMICLDNISAVLHGKPAPLLATVFGLIWATGGFKREGNRLSNCDH